ncbi:MAG: hypothetical protein BGN83_07865 [Rhizobium sp. 63-7]|nr:MAG: hypothetical protein BGN83_07865 [Rhizobium sp. 63-7]
MLETHPVERNLHRESSKRAAEENNRHQAKGLLLVHFESKRHAASRWRAFSFDYSDYAATVAFQAAA